MTSSWGIYNCLKWAESVYLPQVHSRLCIFVVMILILCGFGWSIWPYSSRLLHWCWGSIVFEAENKLLQSKVNTTRNGLEKNFVIKKPTFGTYSEHVSHWINGQAQLVNAVLLKTIITCKLLFLTTFDVISCPCYKICLLWHWHITIPNN